MNLCAREWPGRSGKGKGVMKNMKKMLSAALVAGYEIVPKEPIAQKALPECNITFISGADMKAKVSGYLKVLYDQNPKAVGGTLPDDAFYYGA